MALACILSWAVVAWGDSYSMKILWRVCMHCGLFIIFVCPFHLLVPKWVLEGDCSFVSSWVASLFLSLYWILSASVSPPVTVESASKIFLPSTWKTNRSLGELNYLLTIYWKVSSITALNYGFIFMQQLLCIVYMWLNGIFLYQDAIGTSFFLWHEQMSYLQQ